MTSSDNPPRTNQACLRFEARLSAWLEHDVDHLEAEWMEFHCSRCVSCNNLYRDLNIIATRARTLPRLAPARNLWPEIESRINAITDSSAFHKMEEPANAKIRNIRKKTARRPFSDRWFAIAAVALVSIGTAFTWAIVRSGLASLNSPTLSVSISAVTDSVLKPSNKNSTDSSTGTELTSDNQDNSYRYVSGSSTAYEHEISALHSIVNDRLSGLDSSTVNTLRNNLAIIDQAIADCKAALANDPNSDAASSELTRVTQAKLTLMRRIVQL